MSFPRKRESSKPFTLSFVGGFINHSNEWFDRLTMNGFFEFFD